jgi:hypothetical protein
MFTQKEHDESRWKNQICFEPGFKNKPLDEPVVMMTLTVRTIGFRIGQTYLPFDDSILSSNDIRDEPAGAHEHESKILDGKDPTAKNWT